MKHVIRAIILIIILFSVAVYYQFAPNLVPIISIGFILASAYLITSIINVFRQRSVSGRQAAQPVKHTKDNAGCSWSFLLIVVAAVAYYYRVAVGSYSFQVTLFLDNLVKLTDTVSPLVGWGMLGLLTGAIYGSFVAWKKYKLNAAVNLIPVGIMILFIAILYKVNRPLNATAFAVARNMQTAYAYDLVTAEVSNVPANNNLNYKPSFLLDNNDKTAWITNVNGSVDIEIRFPFNSLQDYKDQHLQCVGFVIKNGYRKSPQTWNNFARIKTVSIKYNDRFITTAIIQDKNSDKEEIKITPIPISSFDNISLTIKEVYSGGKYPNRVAVSELVPIVEYEKPRN